MDQQRNRRLELTLELPYGINGLYFVPACPQCGYRGNQLRKSFKARDYNERVEPLVTVAARRQGWTWTKGQPLRVCAIVYLANKRRDMPNLEKHLIDTIANGLDLDDRYVAALHMFTLYDADDPRVEVSIEVLDEWPTKGAITESITNLSRT